MIAVIARLLSFGESLREVGPADIGPGDRPRTDDSGATAASGAARPGAPRIAFFGNFGTGNLGNECTLAAILARARALLPAARMLVVCVDAEATARAHQVEAVEIFPARRDGVARRGRLPSRIVRRVLGEIETARTAVRVMRRADLLIVPGTGILNDCREGPFGLLYELWKWTLAARVCGRRVCFASVGVEHLDHRLSRLFVRTSLRLAASRTYRDEQSRERIRQMGFAADRDRIFPDLAFSLPESLLRAKAPPARADAVPTVSVGPYDLRVRASGPLHLSYEEYVERLTAFVLWLIEGGRRVRLILGDTRYDVQVTRDMLAALEARGVRPGDGRLVHEPVSSFVELIAHLRDSTAVVASRFHNVILALLLGRPVLSVSYNPKVTAVMESVGLGRYVQAIGDLDGERLAAQFLELEQNAGPLSEAILAKARQYRGDLEEEYRILFGGNDSEA